MKKKLFILLTLLLVCIAGGYFLVKNFSPQTSSQIILYGNIDIRDVALSFRVSGRIEKLYYEEGDRVHVGDVLAELDPVPFNEALTLSQAELLQAKVVFNNAERLFKRRSQLVKAGAVSKEEFDDAESSLDEAKAQVATAEARLAQTITRLNDATLQVPSEGIVLTRVREVGSVVAEGTSVYTMALDNPVWARAYIDEPNLGLIYPNQRVQVLTDSGGTYVGKIGFISPQAEFTPKSVETTQLRTDLVYRLRIIIDAPDNGLRQGMPVTLMIEQEK